MNYVKLLGVNYVNNITIGRYLPYDSFIHRLDPRLKLGALLILLITIFFFARGFLVKTPLKTPGVGFL